MKLMYTVKPDEGCREVSKGIYARPVHTQYQSDLRAKGWAYDPSTLEVKSGKVRKQEEDRKEAEVTQLEESDYVRQEKEVGQEDEEVTDHEVWALAYEKKFGKKPHHKAKTETIKEKVESA